MTEPIIVIDITANKRRILLAGVFLGAVIFAWFAVRWQIGNMFAELTSPNEPNAKEMSQVAVDLAPSDPLANWLAASLEKDIYTPEKIDASVRLFEDVVRMSPYDFRWWIELGRAREQADQPEKAEKAFLRASELAPSYTYPRWQLGNFYLRQNRSDEAFSELRKATENNLTYRDQVFSLAWEYFDRDPAKVESLASDDPDVRMSLALFYAARDRAADSLRIWNTLSDEQKAEHPEYSRIILQGLYDRRFVRQALAFARQGGIDPDAEPEAVTNGGFEKVIGNPDDTYFGWKIVRGEPKVDITSDSSVRHSGTRSLRLSFKGYSKPQLFNLSQVVVVEPGKRYRLGVWIRTEGLKSGGPPVIEVGNVVDNKLIAASAPVPTGTNDWQQLFVDFTAPTDSEGVSIWTSRAYCGEICPITGIVWYDDFSLTRME